MSTKRSVVLRGQPEFNEYGAATEAIKPGYLVKGVSSLAKQTATTGYYAFALAIERGELGQGIDNVAGNGVLAASYAIGDTVKVGVFDAGDEATVWIASGENIVEDDLLESAGNGLFKEGATRPTCRAMETVGHVAVETALRVQVI